MAITRPNLLTDAVARQKYADGVNLLKREFTGPTTKSLGIPGPSRPVAPMICSLCGTTRR